MTFWPIARPLYESADGLGAGAPAEDAPLPDEGGSLADHEASFSPDVVRDDPAPEPAAERTAEPTERDEQGKFKPRGERHRAKSQRASAEDVPRIAELTGKWRTAEQERDALRAEREQLARELDELKRRPAAAQEPPKQAAKPAAEPSDEFTFPDYDKYLDEHPGASYDEWRRKELIAYGDWREQRLDIDGRIAARDAAREADVLVEQKRAKGREAYPDFDEVMRSGLGASVNLHADERTAKARVAAIFRHPQSEHLQYAIMKDGALAQKLSTLDDIGFGLELATLVASVQRSPSSRAAAASTGSAPSLVRPPAPRPPNPVRTGSIAEPDTPPDPDDQSIASHERFFGRRRA